MTDDAGLLPVKIAVTADATKTLERAYDEALAPAAMELGDRGREAAQSLKIFTVPLAAAGNAVEWLFQNPKKAYRFLSETLKRIKGKPREPNAQFLGELLEGAKHAIEGSDTAEMFANLLASAGDSEVTEEVQHPVFPHLVRTMAAGEAQVLRYLAEGKVSAFGLGANQEDIDPEPIGYRVGRGEDSLHLPEYGMAYMARLSSVGLIDVPRFKASTPGWETISSKGQLKEPLQYLWKAPSILLNEADVSLTRFGALFAKAVKLTKK